MKKILNTIANVVGLGNDNQDDLSKYKVGCNLFKDISKTGLYHDYAIELEVSHESANNIYSKLSLSNKNKIRLKRESDRICEVSNIHLLSDSTIKKIYTNLHEEYKDKLPIGADTYYSGGVHFHVFLNQNSDYINFLGDNFNSIKNLSDISDMNITKLKNNSFEFNKIMLHNFNNTLLFFKYYKDHLIGRRNLKSILLNKIEMFQKNDASAYYGNRLDTLCGRYVSWGIKTWSNKLHSIEFRLNQNIDIRLYGYYIGLYLLALNKIKLSNLDLDINDVTKIEKCIDHNNKALDDNKNISCDTIINDRKDAYKLSINNKKVIISNLDIIHKALHANGLKGASKELKKYQKEFNII